MCYKVSVLQTQPLLGCPPDVTVKLLLRNEGQTLDKAVAEELRVRRDLLAPRLRPKLRRLLSGGLSRLRIGESHHRAIIHKIAQFWVIAAGNRIVPCCVDIAAESEERRLLRRQRRRREAEELETALRQAALESARWSLLQQAAAAAENNRRLREADEDIMERVLRESAAEAERLGYGMVPASDKAIAALEMAVVVRGGETTCLVCLDEMRVGWRVLRMPCAHMFHGGCIQRWLRNSHFCPTCRFQMRSA